MNIEPSKVAMNLVNGCLVATLQFDLNRHILDSFREEILQKLQETGARGLLLDCSALTLMDSEDFEGLKRMTEMAALMGTTTVFVGLSAGIVSSLVELDVDLDGIHAALTLEDAFDRVKEFASSKGPVNPKS
ncbi:MAG: STAS domain-containing protein [Nitrospirota bacterium]|nr:MAG: STAS domain-containing protein [Nitrospirota bacterium]